MFSRRKLSRGELIIFGTAITSMTLIAYITSGFTMDGGIMIMAVGLSYLINAIEPGAEVDDERDQRVLLESFRWMTMCLYIIWAVLYIGASFSFFHLSKEMYIIIPMAVCILIQSIARVMLSKFIM
ncbi:hypothetical protein [Macrococcoides bohemicum]|uniref:hypothetical protein n=1 Tax=Macrococcoides bohemicum TaxID=1903056 RepID=UPI001C5FFDED|nr:hypothetical protein [Macrococcus bohemicus]QYA44426.1 hypothetical protein KYI13_10355 [Macrococcus bohemicus]